MHFAMIRRDVRVSINSTGFAEKLVDYVAGVAEAFLNP
jgi:hypothetical protein